MNMFMRSESLFRLPLGLGGLLLVSMALNVWLAPA